MGRKTQIPGREIELLVVERIIGDMHLSIATRDLTPSVQHDGRIVVETGRTTLEERRDQRDA